MKKVAKTGETETLTQSHTTAGEVKLLQLLWCAQEFLPRRYSCKDRGGNIGKLSNCLKNVSPIQVSGYTSLYHFILQLLGMLEGPTVILSGVIYSAPCKLLAKSP